MSDPVAPKRNTLNAHNAMTEAEIDAFLQERREMRLATLNASGTIHLTPAWYLYEDGKIYFALERDRLHLKNLRRNPRATVLMDEDRRPVDGWTAGARAAMFSGSVEIIEDAERTEPFRRRLRARYLGEQTEAADSTRTQQDRRMRYYMIELSPEQTLAWDFSKQA